jgi:Ca2+-binding EF-hand superfamily protein
MDYNDDDKLALEDVKKVMERAFLQQESSKSAEAIAKLMQEFQLDADGLISYSSFVAFTERHPELVSMFKEKLQL